MDTDWNVEQHQLPHDRLDSVMNYIYDIHISAWCGFLERVKDLVQEGVSVDSRNDYGETPLHIAARDGHFEIMDFLISCNCDLNIQEQDGRTPVMLAGHSNKRDVVLFLLQRGAAVHYSERKGKYTLLHLACWRGWADVVLRILESGYADLNAAAGRGGRTPFMVAARMGHKDVSEIFIQAGTDVNRTDNYGHTPLHDACCRGHQDVVKLLLEAGADTNIRARYGHTPLHFACQWGHRQVVRQLLQAGANTTIRNNSGETAVSFGIKHKMLNIEDIKLFLQYGFYFEDREYERLSQNALLKETVLKDVDLCTQTIFNNYNHQSLPALYRNPNVARFLPAKKHFNLKPQQTRHVTNFVESEIEANEFCNVVKKPMVLQMLCVESLISRHA